MEMMKERKRSYRQIRRTVTDMFFLLLACIVGAFSTTAVMIPNGLTSGGLTGIVRIFQSFVDINFSLLYYALAILIWIVVIIMMGAKEAKKVLIVTIMYPAVLMVFAKFIFNHFNNAGFCACQCTELSSTTIW